MALIHHYTFSEASEKLYDFEGDFHLLKVDTFQDTLARWGTSSTKLYGSSIVNPNLFTSPFYNNSFSIAVWMKYNNLSIDQELISGTSGQVLITLETNSSGAINFGLGKGTDPETMAFNVQTSPNLVAVNTWVSLIAIWDKSNSTAQVYLNGDLVGASVHANPPASTTDDWQLGRKYNDTNILEGNLNDLKIFDHVLSASDIRKYGKSEALEIRSDRTYLWEINETIDSLTPNGVFGPATNIVEEDPFPDRVTWGIDGFKTNEVKEGF